MMRSAGGSLALEMEHVTATTDHPAAAVRSAEGALRRVVRRALRVVGSLLLVGGALALVWVIVVWQWQDPFTAIYTHIQQQRLVSRYDREAVHFRPPPRSTAPSLAAAEREVRLEAVRYRRSLGTGEPVGRLTIGRIGLSMMVVQGTDEESLKKGPGHYVGTALPGQGHLIYVAGHRTTYLAPFSHIDSIRNGDYIRFELPYATFTYRAFRHYVVPATDLAMLVDHGREILRLQACHPRFFATHRYIVDARLVSFTLHGSQTSYQLRNT